MWVVYAFGSALFAGVTAILAKCGIRKTDSTVATAVRTVVVVIFSWIMVLIVGSGNQVGNLSFHTLLFLVLSGIATGLSWLCYFKALQNGDINKVVPIDKTSTVLTMLLAAVFLGERLTVIKGISILLIGAGTLLMVQKKKQEKAVRGKAWFLYAVGSAVFASITAILGKVGITGVESNLGTAIRTIVVLIMAWIMVFVTKKQDELKQMDGKELLFICLSGVATGASWLCYYRALQEGEAGIVVPVDKLSIVVTVIFAWIVFKEKLNKRSFTGLILIVAGTMLLLI
ncbi:MAG: EamA family transporter [Eubacteriales bacterium]|nr:EamA family transporter [Eubacteriales bacterium]